MIDYCSKFLPKNDRILRSYDNLGFLSYIHDDLYKSFQAYIEQLNVQLSRHHIQITAMDDGLEDLFKSIENKIEKSMWKDFLQKILKLLRNLRDIAYDFLCPCHVYTKYPIIILLPNNLIFLIIYSRSRLLPSISFSFALSTNFTYLSTL